MKKITIKCHTLVKGIAQGEALVSNQPISLWGGLDPRTGLIIDRRHELCGKDISGKVLIFPYGAGSCSSSAVLLEASRCDKAPSAIVNLETDPIIAIGAILADKMYGKIIPIVDKPEKNPFKMVKTDDFVRVDANAGKIEVLRKVHLRKETFSQNCG